jgi:predicted HicB family RNase H-like nuclease
MAETQRERLERVQFHGRIPPKLHLFLKVWAAQNGFSINDAFIDFAVKGIRADGLEVEDET